MGDWGKKVVTEFRIVLARHREVEVKLKNLVYTIARDTGLGANSRPWMLVEYAPRRVEKLLG